MEYLIKGIVDLYYYCDDHGVHYLVDNGTDELYELKNEEREIIINNTQYIKESKEYIGLLKYTFNDSPSISKRVDNVVLTHKSLINITRDYHNEVCSGQDCIVYEKELPKIKNTFGILMGLNGILISQNVESSDEFYYLSNSQFEFDIFPSIGLYYKVNMLFANEGLCFQYEGTYSRMNLKVSDSYVEPIYEMTYLNDIALTLNTFNNVGILKYEFPKGKIRPTFQIGGFVDYFFRTNYNRSLEVKYS